MTNYPTPDPAPSPSDRPTVLLAVSGGGVAAAWTAPDPEGLAIALAAIVDRLGLRMANPARWAVHDRADDPGAFWAALAADEIPARVTPDAVVAWAEDSAAALTEAITARPGQPTHDLSGAQLAAPVVHPAWAGEGYVRQLAEGMGTPPTGLPLAERARWVAQYALIVQASLMAHPSLVFHGWRGPMPGTGDVGIETAGGGVLAPLANTGYAKSPSGFGWGGGTLGSGPAALAKAMLTAALGRRAACPECAGTGRVTWTPDAQPPGHRPWRPEDGGLTRGDEAVAVTNCRACDHDGIGIPPAVYHKYAADVVAGLPEEGQWRMPRFVVLAWLESQHEDARLAGLARQVER